MSTEKSHPLISLPVDVMSEILHQAGTADLYRLSLCSRSAAGSVSSYCIAHVCHLFESSECTMVGRSFEQLSRLCQSLSSALPTRHSERQRHWEENWISPLLSLAEGYVELDELGLATRALQYANRFKLGPLSNDTHGILQNQFRESILLASPDGKHRQDNSFAKAYFRLFQIPTRENLACFQDYSQKLCEQVGYGMERWLVEEFCQQISSRYKSGRWMHDDVQAFSKAFLYCGFCGYPWKYTSAEEGDLGSVERDCFHCKSSESGFRANTISWLFCGGPFDGLGSMNEL